MLLSKDTMTKNIDPEFLSHIKIEDEICKINAEGMYYRDLNSILRMLDGNSVARAKIQNVYGQRYIGTNMERMEINIFGTPGNDLGAFMNGTRLIVHGNAQDGCGNTLNDGEIIVHGGAGDITGYSMRGGRIFVRDDVGYRAGIHMKEYKEKKPSLVIGGTAQDFLGEYMAGGTLVVLGLNLKEREFHNARFIGTGMHGGAIYVRGKTKHLSDEVEPVSADENEMGLIEGLVKDFCNYFNLDLSETMAKEFTKIRPVSSRPYGKLYAY